MLFLQLGPYLQLVDEVTQELIRLVQDILEAMFLVNTLQAMSVNIYEEPVCVRILRHRQHRQNHVNQHFWIVFNVV